MWGDYAHYGGTTANRSPDHAALASMAEARRSSPARASARTEGGATHQPMGAGVYPVHGGMEDWAYAASWDPARLTGCAIGRRRLPP